MLMILIVPTELMISRILCKDTNDIKYTIETNYTNTLVILMIPGVPMIVMITKSRYLLQRLIVQTYIHAAA